MKNKLLLTLILLLASSPCVFAIQEGKVISDMEKKQQKELMDSFNDVNQYTNYIFTPHSNKPKVDDNANADTNEKVIKNIDYDTQLQGTLPPVKRARLLIQKNLQNKKNKNVKAEIPIIEEAPDQAIMDCDNMEYFAERKELEANGNVSMFFPENKSTIKADRMIYNQASNIINAYGHVVLISEGKKLFGDYMKIDMNEENALMDNPITETLQIRAKAKKGYMYGDKIIQEQGNFLVTKHTKINIISEMFGPNLDNMFVDEKDKTYYSKDKHGEKFRIKMNELVINSKKEHDVVTMKHAEFYFNEKKICMVPTFTVHTNKNRDYVEANFPELGTMTNMGLYAGPGFVFDTPKGTTLKVIPILNYQGNGDTNESSFGWGGIGKFKSATNKTDFAYGTTNKIFLLRGKQKLDDNLYFQYSTNSYMDDWFLGYRMPKVLGELIYQDDKTINNFMGPRRNFTFTNRIAAAYAQDGDYTTGLFDNDNFTGTMRLKYMAEAAQTIWQFNDMRESPINASLSIVGQGSAAVYGSGQTQMIGRIGPRLHTQYKPWMQDIGYFLSTYDDKTPFAFDRYVYGRSNAYVRESLRLCKYLTFSWFGSMNLSQDSWDGKLLQENSFFLSIGPDDVKLNVGYDTIRQQTFVTMAMHLDAKGTNVEYKKMIIKNPETLGKNPNGQSAPSAESSAFMSPVEGTSSLERAEVVNIEGTL